MSKWSKKSLFFPADSMRYFQSRRSRGISARFSKVDKMCDSVMTNSLGLQKVKKVNENEGEKLFLIRQTIKRRELGQNTIKIAEELMISIDEIEQICRAIEEVKAKSISGSGTSEPEQILLQLNGKL